MLFVLALFRYFYEPYNNSDPVSAGNVTFVELFEDEMGKSMGCGLVEYSTQEEAKKAIDSLNDSKLNGREIKVKTVSFKPILILFKPYVSGICFAI